MNDDDDDHTIKRHHFVFYQSTGNKEHKVYVSFFYSILFYLCLCGIIFRIFRQQNLYANIYSKIIEDDRFCFVLSSLWIYEIKNDEGE